MTCSYVFWKVIEIYLLDAILRNPEAQACRVHGVMADTIALGRDHLGEDFAAGVSPVFYPRVVLNTALTGLAMLFTLAAVAWRIRPVVKVEKFAVALDRMRDSREYELIKEIAPAGRLLFVERFPSFKGHALPEGIDYTSCLRTDGLFGPMGGARAILDAVIDITRLAVRHWRTPPGLLYEMLTLPYKRLLVRGLVNRYRPNAFIGRDEYNVDHVMRRAELRPLGIKSIGLSNGLYPCFSLLVPNVRYISFDTFYVDAAPLFTQYLETWADDMRMLTMGGFSIPREKQLMRRTSLGEDILFTIRVAWNRPEMVRMVRAAAEAFPERKIILQFKSGFVSDGETQRLVRECGEGLDNFEHTTENVYVLLARAKYHISDISTFVAEAIRSGMTTFLADLLDQEFNCYRLFPGLALNTAEQLVEKLKALESGQETYPRKKYFDLLDYREGEVGFDRLREEIGIHPS
ncbi:MAG: hypothetical protein HQ513_19090 [Rhodospirillales bacterium]|nr:hypothetical protein [Rhodospirillales bacterium]